MPTSPADELQRRKSKALELGGAANVERLKARGALTARERIAALLDPGTFFETGMLNHSDVPGMENKTPADGKICGFGMIAARPVAVTADDPTVLAGSGGRVGSAKSMRVHQMAIRKGIPIVNLGEAGGARIPDIQGSDGLSSMTMKTEAGRRMRRVPMVSTIMGDCFGAPSWMAALSDFVVQVKGSCMAVSGPRVLEMATGERVCNEELGGWKLHAEITGQADRVADHEADCFQIVKDFLSYLPGNADTLPARAADHDPHADQRQTALKHMVPTEPQRGYDMTRVIQTIVDHERIFPIKPDFDRSVIACLARLDGHAVGIVASQPSKLSGAMGPEGCDKCIAFLTLCDSFHIPVIFLHDTPGFRVGKDAEARRMPSKIINFITALSMVTVPKISLVIRKSYGMAYSNMGGHGMGSDFEFAWPGAEISFMAPEVAANVVYQRKIEQSPNPREDWSKAVDEMRLGSAPWRAAGLGYLDDVIRPEDTRATLILALNVARGARQGRSERLLANWPTRF